MWANSEGFAETAQIRRLAWAVAVCLCDKYLFIWADSNLSHLMTKPTKWRAPSEDSDQPGHPPSLIRVFAVRMKKNWVLSYPLSTLRRLWSDLADAQADLSLCWVHMPFCWFCHAVAHLISVATTPYRNGAVDFKHCVPGRGVVGGG